MAISRSIRKGSQIRSNTKQTKPITMWQEKKAIRTKYWGRTSIPSIIIIIITTSELHVLEFGLCIKGS